MITFQDSCKYALLDCDGVILNTNSLKQQAFLSVASNYCSEVPRAYIDYLRKSAGLSRFEKLAKLIEITCPGIEKHEFEIILSKLVDNYSTICRDIMSSAEVNWDFIGYCSRRFSSRCMGVVSNSEETELRSVFEDRKLSGLFGLGVFGSPTAKASNLAKILKEISDISSVVYVGDTQSDRECCESLGLPFVLYSPWKAEIGL